MPPSEELQQTASDVAAISGLSLQERKALKESFKAYLSLTKNNKKNAWYEKSQTKGHQTFATKTC